MNKAQYIAFIKEELDSLAEAIFPAQELHYETTYDDTKQRYMLLTMGIDGGIDIFEIAISVKVTDDKIIIEENMTDKDLKDILIEKGVPIIAFTN